jgi:hypothetical protein
MTWRNRKLFNDLPQGIVSGLEPIPRYQMGGMVQGYEAGGKTYPNKGLEALAKEAPEVVKRMGYEDGGFINPRNYLGGGTVQYPMGMEMGSLVPEVFESGDQQINDALNNALSVTGVTNDMMAKEVAPMNTDKVAAPSLDVSEEPESISMADNVNEAVDMLTSQYKEAARSLVKQAKQNLFLEDNMNITEVEKNLQEKLDLLDEEYKSRVQEVLYEVDMPLDTKELRDVTLFDQNFQAEIEREMLENLGEEKIALSETNIPKLEHGGIHPTPEEIYNQRMQEKADKRNLARTGTLFSGKTLQGGLAGFFDVVGQAQKAESDKIVPENRIDMTTARTAEYKQNQALNVLNDASLTEEQKAVMLSALGINLGSGGSDATGTMKNVAEVKRIQQSTRDRIAAINASTLPDEQKKRQIKLAKETEKYELDVLGANVGDSDAALDSQAAKQALDFAETLIKTDGPYFGRNPIEVAEEMYNGLRPGRVNTNPFTKISPLD